MFLTFYSTFFLNNLILFNIFTEIKVRIVPKIIEIVTFSFRKIILKTIAKKGTKNINELTSEVPSFSIPKSILYLQM